MSKIDDEFIKFNSFNSKTLHDIKELKDVDKNDINKSGIYILYIDSYFNDYNNTNIQVSPLYIGQTKNLFKRKQQHLNEIRKIMNFSTKSYNEILNKHNEHTYLYSKIRLCLSNCDLSFENVKIKVLEYCDKNDLLIKEQYYIKKYCGIEYGFNQFESLHLISQHKANDDYYFEFLNKAKQDLLNCLNNKYFFGFTNFNILMLCHNILCILKLIENYHTESKELILLSNEIFDLLSKVQQVFFDYYEYSNLDFIYYYLKERKK